MKKISLFILCFISVLASLGQSLSINDVVIDNSSNLEFDSDVDFTESRYIEAYQYIGSFKAGYNLTINKVLVKNIETEALPAERAMAINVNSLSSTIIPEVTIGTHRKKPFVTVSFVPYIYGKNGVERIISYEIEVIGLEKGRLKSLSDLSAETSVLASGEIFKVKVTKTGMYKLSRSFLTDLGVDVNQLNPALLNVYGHPEGMLPIDNSEYLPGDPNKLSIDFVGNSDQSFDEGEYFVFYAEGPDEWNYSSNDVNFQHSKNLYDNASFFYIKPNDTDPKRIGSISNSSDSPTMAINSYDEYSFHEVNTLNLIKSGRIFFGEIFDADIDQNFLFSVSNQIENEPIIIRTGVAAHKKSSGSSSFTINPSGGNSHTFSVSAATGKYEYARYKVDNYSYIPSSFQGNLNIELKYNKGDPTNIGYLDFLSIQYRKELSYQNSPFTFRESRNLAPTQIAEYQIAGNIDDLRIWEVSDFQNSKAVETNAENGILTFIHTHNELRHYAAFKNSQLLNPTIVGAQINQNLHAASNIDMVIVTHSDFMSAAQELALFHEADNINSLIVTQTQLFNEFSCGKKDPTAIKHFMKMLYDDAANEDEIPRYLLLLGDASYDIRPESTTSLVYTYESFDSWDLIDSYLTDDYFGLLDDDESDRPQDLVDIGIGRFTVTTLGQANDIIKKIKYYKKTHTANVESSVNEFNTSPFGDWRNLVSFVADDEDGNTHMNHAEILSGIVEDDYPVFNIDKIYFDAYQQISTPGGERYPEVNQKIDERVQKGALILNYIGHGGEVGWAHERVLDVNTIVNWSNLNNMPLFMTATCEFSRFDDPGRISAGEYCLLNPNGGAIALLSTTRLVFSSSNLALARKFYDYVFDDMTNLDYCLGDITMLTKRASSVSSSTNHRNFSLLGDPALRLVYPQLDINTSEINQNIHIDAVTVIDTLNALSKVTFKGSIDLEGEDPSGYNATLYPTVYGKEKDVLTLGNDGNPYSFKIQNSVLFKGKASVNSGEFEFEFVVPKDISFQYGVGKVSYYMSRDNSDIDGFGYSKAFMVGGANVDAAIDITGPQIEVFLNEDNFVSGSIINENPILLSEIFDESGINTAGSGIGHDITVVIDGETDKTIVLNDFYESDLDTYTSGALKYQMSKLEDGKHTLELKAWDVYNNSSSKTLDFEVKKEEELAISNVINYPNPFTNYTEFWFEHNQASTSLDVRVQVFTVSGKLVKTIHRPMLTDGYRSEPISWDGLDDYGDRLARGVYVYKLRVSEPSGKAIEKFEKLVILN